MSVQTGGLAFILEQGWLRTWRGSSGPGGPQQFPSSQGRVRHTPLLPRVVLQACRRPRVTLVRKRKYLSATLLPFCHRTAPLCGSLGPCSGAGGAGGARPSPGEGPSSVAVKTDLRWRADCLPGAERDSISLPAAPERCPVDAGPAPLLPGGVLFPCQSSFYCFPSRLPQRPVTGPPSVMF